jgi:hypothetical protein
VIHRLIPPPVKAGTRWYLPSGNVVEVLPSLVYDDDYVVCKYIRRSTISILEAEAGVTLTTSFLYDHAKAV